MTKIYQNNVKYTLNIAKIIEAYPFACSPHTAQWYSTVAYNLVIRRRLIDKSMLCYFCFV